MTLSPMSSPRFGGILHVPYEQPPENPGNAAVASDLHEYINQEIRSDRLKLHDVSHVVMHNGDQFIVAPDSVIVNALSKVIPQINEGATESCRNIRQACQRLLAQFLYKTALGQPAPSDTRILDKKPFEQES